MPAVVSTRPFEHRCIHCGTKPTNLRKRRTTDKETGNKKFAGEYYSCICYSLTVSLDNKANLNQTEECTRPDLLLKAA